MIRSSNQTFALRGLAGDHKDKQYLLKDDFKIGREQDNDIIINEGFVSRHHATIKLISGILTISDNGSSNGTFVNNKPIETSILSEGDTVKFDIVEFTVCDASAREDKTVISAPSGDNVSNGLDRQAQLEKELEELQRAQEEREKLLKQEKERLAKEEQLRIEKEAQAAKEEAERVKAEEVRQAKEKAEKERLAKEAAEKEKAAQEKAAKEEAEKAEKKRLEDERIAKEKAEKERVAQEQATKEKAEKERLKLEKAEQEKQRKEKQAKEKSEKKAKAAEDKAEKDRLAKVAADKAVKEKAQKERDEKEKKERLEKQREDEILAKERLTSQQNNDDDKTVFASAPIEKTSSEPTVDSDDDKTVFAPIDASIKKVEPKKTEPKKKESKKESADSKDTVSRIHDESGHTEEYDERTIIGRPAPAPKASKPEGNGNSLASDLDDPDATVRNLSPLSASATDKTMISSELLVDDNATMAMGQDTVSRIRQEAAKNPQDVELLGLTEPVEDRRFKLNKALLTVGRSPFNDIIIKAPSVSSQHAELEMIDSAWLVRDLESSNGTYINDMLVEEELLYSDDCLMFGEVEFTFDPNGLMPPPEDREMEIIEFDSRYSSKFWIAVVSAALFLVVGLLMLL